MTAISYINSVTVASPVTTVTLSNIPATFTDLILTYSIKSDGAASTSGGRLRFNSNSTSNYAFLVMYPAASIGGNNQSSLRTFGDFPTTHPEVGYVWIPQYTNTNFFKHTIAKGGSTVSAGAFSGVWRVKDAINSITILGNDDGVDNISSGSTITLWGVV